MIEYVLNDITVVCQKKILCDRSDGDYQNKLIIGAKIKIR
jgi:hypothetical protein